MSFDAASDTYRLDSGSLAGVTEGALVALYPPMDSPAATSVFPPLDTPEDVRQRIGLLRVISADRATSEAKASPALPPPSPLPANVRGRLVQLGKDARMRVALRPHDEALARRLAQSPFLEIARPGDEAEMTLVQRSDGFWAMTDDVYGTGEEPGPPVPTLLFLPATAPPPGAWDTAVKLVEHYSWYAAPLRAGRRCTDLPHGISIRLLDCNSMTAPLPEDQAQDPKLPELSPGTRPNYELRAGRYDRVARRWITMGDAFAIQIDNTSTLDLWVTLFDCDSDGRVRILASQSLLQSKGRATFWISPEAPGVPLAATLSENQTLGVDRYVAIATTDKRASLAYLELRTSFVDAANGSEKAVEPPSFGASERWTAAFAVVRMKAR